MTLLAIDVGNTNTVIGVFSPGAKDPTTQWRAATDAHRTGDQWLVTIAGFLNFEGIDINNVDGIVVGSVVPEVTVALRRMCVRLDITPVVVTYETNIGIDIRLDDPREVGPDRLANAVAAFGLLGGPAIVVDLGTATTLDVIAEDGAYLGGVIIPGVEISLDALFQRAAALKRIELSPPPSVIGTSTATAVRSGATFGYAAQIDGLCDQIEKTVGACRIVSTGGLSTLISPLSTRIESQDPALTLRGLRMIFERNS